MDVGWAKLEVGPLKGRIASLGVGCVAFPTPARETPLGSFFQTPAASESCELGRRWPNLFSRSSQLEQDNHLYPQEGSPKKKAPVLQWFREAEEYSM